MSVTQHLKASILKNLTLYHLITLIGSREITIINTFFLSLCFFSVLSFFHHLHTPINCVSTTYSVDTPGFCPGSYMSYMNHGQQPNVASLQAAQARRTTCCAIAKRRDREQQSNTSRRLSGKTRCRGLRNSEVR